MTAGQTPLRILLVDDEAPARKRLRNLLDDIAAACPSRVVGEAANGKEALALLAALPAAERADLALVDIRMPGMDGIELAQHLAGLPQPPALIFVTAYDAHAVQAFELNAIDYLLKPVRAERLQQALEKVRQQLGTAPVSAPPPATLASLREGPRRHLACHERGKLLLVPVADILYLRADLKYVAARTAEREYLLDEALVQLEQEFAEQFIRIHRGALVARQAIAGCERGHGDGEDGEGSGEQWWLLLRGIADKLPVSRRQWPLLRALLKSE
jgi:two-component system response regulator AlgR